MRRIHTALLISGALVLGACGGDDEPADEPAAEPAGETADEPAAEPADEPAAEPAAEPADEPAAEPADEPAAAPSGGKTATLTLDNGESFEFGVLCSLEPQVAAGSEILFTATSYDDPGLDITQFGDDGTVTGVATVSVYDGSYNTLWEASTFNEPFGGSLELSLDGTTINGTGTFFAGGDPVANPEGVNGTVEARCG